MKQICPAKFSISKINTQEISATSPANRIEVKITAAFDSSIEVEKFAEFFLRNAKQSFEISAEDQANS